VFYSYNNVRFDVLTTNSHAMEAVYAEDGADYLYTRFHVDVTAALNLGTAHLKAEPGLAGHLPLSDPCRAEDMSQEVPER